MAKSRNASSGKPAAAQSPAATVVRDAKTGRVVTVMGVGALKASALKIRKGVSLLKPIARQALGQQTDRD